MLFRRFFLFSSYLGPLLLLFVGGRGSPASGCGFSFVGRMIFAAIVVVVPIVVVVVVVVGGVTVVLVVF